MKAGREHRVPLSDAALAIIEAMRKLRHADDGGFVFQGGKHGRPLSEHGLADDAAPHGARATYGARLPLHVQGLGCGDDDGLPA